MAAERSSIMGARMGSPTIAHALTPVPGPDDVAHLAAVGLLLGFGHGWQPKFQPADRTHVAKAKSILKELGKAPIHLEVRNGGLYYGEPAAVSLMELTVLIAWQAPLAALLTSPKRGRSCG